MPNSPKKRSPFKKALSLTSPLPSPSNSSLKSREDDNAYNKLKNDLIEKVKTIAELEKQIKDEKEALKDQRRKSLNFERKKSIEVASLPEQYASLQNQHNLIMAENTRLKHKFDKGDHIQELKAKINGHD